MINHAKSVLAEQLKIPEAAALRRLRHEARNQRRSMSELATIIIEAHNIVGRLNDSDHGGTKKPSRRPPQAHEPSHNGDGAPRPAVPKDDDGKNDAAPHD